MTHDNSHLNGNGGHPAIEFNDVRVGIDGGALMVDQQTEIYRSVYAPDPVGGGYSEVERILLTQREEPKPEELQLHTSRRCDFSKIVDCGKGGDARGDFGCHGHE